MKKRSLFLLGIVLIAAAVWFALRPVHLKKEVHRPSSIPSKERISFPAGTGTIAIVLDDWGYTMRQVKDLQSIAEPLTLSVLPNLPFSRRVAEEAHAHGDEVILHMPMEAVSSSAPREKATLLTTMSREEIVKRLDHSLDEIPHARGISNHQGSKATAERAVMEIVMDEAKRRNLYFLDSFVTPKSVCDQVARTIKIRFVRRDIFLDNDQDPAAIEKNLFRLAAAASRNGQALGIGHDRPNMLKVLKQDLPALKRAGYKIVAASELARVPSD